MRPETIAGIPFLEYRNSIYNILGSTSKIGKDQMDDLIAWRKFIVQFAGHHPRDVFINGQVIERTVSLTFDDGPDSYVTPRILDILKRNKIKGNFFFTGNQINLFPGVVRRAFDEGHLILNHSWNHPYFTEISPQGITNEIISTENRIKEITGKKPAILRPPYGAVDGRVLPVIKASNNRVVIWSTDSMDWVHNADQKTITGNILSNVRPGEIILMHSSMGHNVTAESLQVIIDGLKDRAFKIDDLGELLGVAPYKQ